MIKYCLLTVEYNEHCAHPIPFAELGDHVDDATGEVDLGIYESGETDDIADTWANEADSDLDIYALDDAEIYSDEVVSVYILSDVPSSQTFEMHYTDPAEDYIDGYTGSGRILVVNRKNKSDADVLAYTKQKIAAADLASYIVVGDVAKTIVCDSLSNTTDDTEIISCCYIGDGSTETEFIGTEDEVTNAVCEFINKSRHKDDIEMVWHEDEDSQGDIVMNCESFKTICDEIDAFDHRLEPNYISDENANKILNAFGVRTSSREFRGDSVHKNEYDSSLVRRVLNGFIYEDPMYEALTESLYNEWPDVDIDGNVIKE